MSSKIFKLVWTFYDKIYSTESLGFPLIWNNFVFKDQFVLKSYKFFENDNFFWTGNWQIMDKKSANKANLFVNVFRKISK